MRLEWREAEPHLSGSIKIGSNIAKQRFMAKMLHNAVASLAKATSFKTRPVVLQYAPSVLLRNPPLHKARRKGASKMEADTARHSRDF